MLFRTGRQIAFARTKKGLTTYALAEQLDVAQSSIVQWETGIRLPGKKNHRLLEKAPDILDIEIDTFDTALIYEKYLESLTKSDYTMDVIVALKASTYFKLLMLMPREKRGHTIKLREREYLLFLDQITVNDYMDENFVIEPTLFAPYNLNKSRSITFGQLCDFALYLYNSIKVNFIKNTVTVYDKPTDFNLEIDCESHRPVEDIYHL